MYFVSHKKWIIIHTTTYRRYIHYYSLAWIQLHDSLTPKTFHEFEFRTIFLYRWIDNKIFIREYWQMRDYDEWSFLKFKISTFPITSRMEMIFGFFNCIYWNICNSETHVRWWKSKSSETLFFFLLYSYRTVIFVSLFIFVVFFFIVFNYLLACHSCIYSLFLS